MNRGEDDADMVVPPVSSEEKEKIKEKKRKGYAGGKTG
jgi:hypothetical protein